MNDNTEALPEHRNTPYLLAIPAQCRGAAMRYAESYARAALAQRQQVQEDKWDGAEEWMPLAWELCADECGEEACNELVWEGGPVPEPWGERWLKYEGEAKRLVALVRKHVPALTAAPSAQPAIEPLLFRDLALELGVSVATLTQTIARRGLGNFSVNMAVPVTVAKAARDPAFGLVRDAAPSAQAEPVAFTSQHQIEELRARKAGFAGRPDYLYAHAEPGGIYTVPLYTAPPAAQAEPQVPLPEFLTAQDKSDLLRIEDCFSDGEGYDLPRERMQRLSELGVIRHNGGGVYSITAFGMYCTGAWPALPLKTAAESNAEAARLHAERMERGITKEQPKA